MKIEFQLRGSLFAWTLAVMAAGAGQPPALAQFTSSNVSQEAWLDLTTLGAGSGNDCWGYVSPSGREYALMGLNNKVTVVEITTPGSPTIVGSVSHTPSSWGDIKTYDTYAYVVNESGGGMDVINLADVDSGIVTLVQRLTTNGLSTSHNVAVNTDSGYLYLPGSNLNGGAPVVYSLADPANPVEVGRWTGGSAAYHHDAHIITYTDGPYAGREILFGFSEGRGVDILDVTDKSNIFLLSRTPYPGVQYCHQGWTSDDRRFLFVDDELDEGATTPTTRTIIFDIADLTNPVLISEYTNGLNSRDHNLYPVGCTLFAANYSSGLRVINFADPFNPVEVGFYDTHPEDDATNFDGAWSCYPYFPSGTVIVSDIDRGLFVLNPAAAYAASDAIPGGLVFGYPDGRPSLINPAGGTTMQVDISGLCGSSLSANSPMLNYDTGDGFVSVPLTPLGGDLFEATFPGAPCPQEVQYYVSAERDDLTPFTNPPGAPVDVYVATAATGTTTTVLDDFETDLGWIAENLGATSGNWQRGTPVNDPLWDYDPISDGDGSGQCYLTQNAFGNTDVDNGAVRLTSPQFDLSGGGKFVTYQYYLYLTVADGTDRLLVEASDNGLFGPWNEVARHDTSAGTAWRTHILTESDLLNAGVVPSSTMRIRFTANDADVQSIVESGIDGFTVAEYDCPDSATCPNTCGDIDGSGGPVDLQDFASFALCFQTPPSASPACACSDLNGDGAVDLVDFATFSLNFSSASTNTPPNCP